MSTKNRLYKFDILKKKLESKKLKEKLKDYTKSGLCDSTITELYIDTYVEILQDY